MLLAASILIRLAAAGWSVVLMRRIRDRRMLFLTAMLVLMALRQLLTLGSRVRDLGLPASLSMVDPSEAPGVLVSVLAAFATVQLARIIFEARATAQALRERDAQLAESQKLDAIGQLAGGVAHDFNNLLTVILANVELARPATRDPDVRESLDSIEHASQSAAGLTRRLLAFARREVVDARPLDLSRHLAGLYPMMRSLLPANLELSVAPAAAVWPVVADALRMEQVVLNLVGNARDACGERGSVRLGVENVSFGELEAKRRANARAGDYVCLWVEDDGVGMSAETQARIFEPFFTTKEPGRGTGLGLAICYGVARQMGGFISVRSAPGEGTRIEVYLPRAADDDAAAPVPPMLHGVPAGGRERLLVVDDEPRLRESLAAMLRAHGYRVTCAANGADALALPAEVLDGVDLLLTDVVMPQLGGEQLVANLRARRPGLRVLFMSGYSPSHVRGTAPAGEFLQKPFDQRTLLTRVRAALEAAPPGPPAVATRHG